MSNAKVVMWTEVTDSLPPVYYDTKGNWASEYCLLFRPNAEITYAMGYFNPVGVFEDMEFDSGSLSPVFVGQVSDPEDENYIKAWMPLPEYEEAENDSEDTYRG